jgi:hypothetical protein
MELASGHAFLGSLCRVVVLESFLLGQRATLGGISLRMPFRVVSSILGRGSTPILAEASVWQNIFTHLTPGEK